MKKVLLRLTMAVMMSSLIVSQAEAVLINGGFETSGLSGWTSTVPWGGSATVVTSYATTTGPSVTFGPVEGDYFASLKTDGPGSYTTLSQPIFLNVDDVLSGWAAFDANDYMPFNDNAYVKIFNSSGLVATPWYDDVVGVGNYGNSDWTPWDWTATASDTYTLELGVANGTDYALESYALFDANIHTAIPEPTSMLLLGIGLIGLAGRKIRKRKKKLCR